MRSDRDKYDDTDVIAPQREKKRGWDVPSPEQSYKHTPKPWDKKKKEKETIETMVFGPTEEWDAEPAPKASDVKGKGKGKGKVKVKEETSSLSPSKTRGDVKLENEAPGASQSKAPDVQPEDLPDTQADRRDDKGPEQSPRKGKGKKSDDRYAQRRLDPPLVLMEDLQPGRSKGQWDHSGYTEVEPPTGSQNKFDNARGRGRGKTRGRGSGRDSGPSKKGFGKKAAEVEVEKPEKLFKERGPASSTQPKESTSAAIDILADVWGPDPLAKPSEVTPLTDTEEGEGGVSPRSPEDKAPARKTALGEWSPAPSNASIPNENASSSGNEKDSGLDNGEGTSKADSSEAAEGEKKDKDTEVGKVDTYSASFNSG